MRAKGGLMAEFVHPQAVFDAATKAYAVGYRLMDAYTPYPVEGLAAAMGRARSVLPLILLIAGLCGGVGGYLMQWLAMAKLYPLNIGGRPLHSWPAFIPPTFELTILSAAVVGVVALFVILRFPRLYHPVFAVEGFERATADRFFLCIEKADPLFRPEATRQFLLSLHPVRIAEVGEVAKVAEVREEERA